MSDYYTSNGDPEATKAIAERYGFCLVRGLFRPAEIAELENDLAADDRTRGGDFPDLYSCGSLRWIMIDDRVRALAAMLLGSTPVYYRETNIVYEQTVGPRTLNPYSEFHCDARGTRDSLLAGWDGNPGEIYPAYRFAVYFRNYRDYSGGLKVAVGSHLRSLRTLLPFKLPETVRSLPKAAHWFGSMESQIRVVPFELFNIPSIPGDLVIFNLRCFHSAGAVRMRDRPTFASLPQIEESMRVGAADEMCLPRAPGSRNAIFFDYGAPSEDVDFYIKWRALEKKNGRDAKSFTLDSPTGIALRNDSVIASLGINIDGSLEHLRRQGKQISTLDEAPGEMRENLQVMFDLCRAHREFSPYHPLFDRAAFERTSLNPLMAVLGVIRDMKAATARLTEKEAELRRVAKQAS